MLPPGVTGLVSDTLGLAAIQAAPPSCCDQIRGWHLSTSTSGISNRFVNKTNSNHHPLTESPPTPRARLIVALAIAVATALIAWHKSHQGALFDYTHYEYGGR